MTRYVDELGTVLTHLPKVEKFAGAGGFVSAFEGIPAAKMEQAAKTVQKYGLALTNLKSVTTEASTGIKTLNFSQQEGEQFWRKATLHIDKFGNVLTDTQKRFRSFTDGIKRNIGESLKWMVAISAVYGTFQKLQQVITEAIDNQARLADIGIILGASQEKVAEVFDASYEAAQKVGEGIDGVIEGFAGAYRATGSYRDEAQRTAVATQLLTDSIILSKLSSLDQAQALDTLAGALRQTGLGLDQGQVLLNKWIAVSKQANVDLKTLAESFAITSTTAENAGLSFDQLNAVVATVAETTTLSATEAGNAVRAFISGFQTDNARDELASFGIAVEDMNGEARDFLDVMYEIASLSDAGLISQDQLNQIAESIGGGARRGAQVMAFIENLQRVAEITEVSMNAQGEVMDALDIKLDTVQTSLTRLDNAFQNLATTMGDEGGVLNVTKILVDLLTSLTDALSKITESLGGVTPVLLAMGGAMAYLGKNGAIAERMTGFLGTAGVGIAQRLGRTQTMEQLQREADVMNARMLLNPTANANQMRANQVSMMGAKLQPWAMPGIMTATMAIGNVAQKDWEGLGGNIAGGLVGAVIGGPMGMVVGSMIGEVAADTLLSYDKDFSKMFADIWTDSSDSAKNNAEDTAKSIEEREAALLEKLITRRGLGGGGANIDKWRTQFTDWIGDTLGIEQLDILKEGVEIPTSAVARKSLESDIETYKLQLSSGFLTDNAREYYTAQLTEAEALLEALKAIETERKRLAEVQTEQDMTTPYGRRVAKGTEARASQWSEIEQQKIEEYTDKLNKQEITVKQYTEAMDRMKADGLLVNQVFEAMGTYAEKYGLTFQETANLVIDSNDEQMERIITLKGEIAGLYDELVKASEAGDIRTAVRIDGSLREAQELLAQYNEELYKAQRMSQLQLTSPMDLDVTSVEDYNLLMEEAMKDFQALVQENIKLGLIPEDATEQEVLDAYEDVFARVAELGISKLEDIPDFILKDTYERLKEAGKIQTSETKSKFRVETADMTQGAFMSNYNSWMSKLTSAFGDYWTPQPEDVGMIFSDGMDVLHLDNLVMQLAMQDLIDVNEKQLDGIYNLPSDTSFYVPFQGYKMGFANQGGGGGGLSLADVSALFEKILAAKETAPTEEKDFRGWWDKYYEDKAAKEAWHAPMVLPQGEEPLAALTEAEKKLQGTLGEDFGTRQRLLQEMSTGGSLGSTQMPQDLGGTIKEMSNVIKTLPGKLSTSLRIDSNTNVVLNLNGQQIATAILPYLYEELIRYESTGGASTTRVVI
jgi:TP901 family phage tail tape measure protein